MIKLEGKYQRKPMLFWRYLAARTINEMVKKHSLRSAVACYLSGKGRHIELNLFELPKIDIYFRSHTFLYNIGQPFFLFRLSDMRYSWRNMTRISGNVIKWSSLLFYYQYISEEKPTRQKGKFIVAWHNNNKYHYHHCRHHQHLYLISRLIIGTHGLMWTYYTNVSTE